MRTLFRFAFVASLALLLTSAAAGKRIAIPPLADRIGRADTIVSGKVTALEDKKIKLPGGGEAILATVKVDKAIVGAKGLTHVKIAVNEGALEANQEGCFLLNAVKGENYYTISNRRFFFGIIRADEGNYEKQLEAIKKCGSLMDDPAKGLKSKETGDRLLTAALLIGKYRPQFERSEKTEAIDGDQSKLILEALADADWKMTHEITGVNGQNLFYRLGLTPQDGWTQPQDFSMFEKTAKEWLKANAGKYKIKRFVLSDK